MLYVYRILFCTNALVLLELDQNPHPALYN